MFWEEIFFLFFQQLHFDFIKQHEKLNLENYADVKHISYQSSRPEWFWQAAHKDRVGEQNNFANQINNPS